MSQHNALAATLVALMDAQDALTATVETALETTTPADTLEALSAAMDALETARALGFRDWLTTVSRVSSDA